MLSRLDAFKLDAFCTGKLVISFEAFFFFFFVGGIAIGVVLSY